MAKALEGIKVLDFTRALAGPYCTYILRDMGAEVIKVEMPGEGDPVRGLPPLTAQGDSPHFITRNRGKKSITLNLASAKGKQMVKDLAQKVDILVENFSPGVMDRLGLGYEELSKVNPKLVYASISGFGHTGPRTSEAALDIVAQAMGGLMSITGYPDGPPTKVGTMIGDVLGGLYTTIAILGALRYSLVTGEGQMIDTSMQDSVFAVASVEFPSSYFLDNQVPRRSGNAHPVHAPFGTFPAKDGTVVICVQPAQWETFLKTIGRDDLIGNPGYADLAGRAKHRDEIIAFTEEWTKARTMDEVLTTLRNAHVPCSPVPSIDQVAHDPQLLTRNMIIEVDQPLSGKVKVTGSVFKMSKSPCGLTAPAPALGEHNREIYSRLLGYSEAEIKKLAAEGII